MPESFLIRLRRGEELNPERREREKGRGDPPPFCRLLKPYFFISYFFFLLTKSKVRILLSNTSARHHSPEILVTPENPQECREGNAVS